ncbi:MAG TPA: hypothetical protein VHU87_15905 [Rhizomicrobium sp.]|jgi:hypothetical protein|nr:hypothetical protein [Rhizomicrobium sp.]
MKLLIASILALGLMGTAANADVGVGVHVGGVGIGAHVGGHHYYRRYHCHWYHHHRYCHR